MGLLKAGKQRNVAMMKKLPDMERLPLNRSMQTKTRSRCFPNTTTMAVGCAVGPRPNVQRLDDLWRGMEACGEVGNSRDSYSPSVWQKPQRSQVVKLQRKMGWGLPRSSR